MRIDGVDGPQRLCCYATRFEPLPASHAHDRDIAREATQALHDQEMDGHQLHWMLLLPYTRQFRLRGGVYVG